MPTAYDAYLATMAERLELLDTDAPATARNAGTVPLALLPHLAWSRSLDYWDPTWPASVKRQLVTNTPANLRRRGTRAAIDSALSAFGADIVVEEWHEQDPEGPPGTAIATALLGTELGSSTEAQDTARTLLGREGRYSIHWTLELGVAGIDAIAAVGNCRAAVLTQYTGVQSGA